MASPTSLVALGVAAGLLLAGCGKSKPVWPPDEKPAGWTPTDYAESVAVQDPGSTLPQDWWRTAIFYEVHVRSFQDSDGDGYGDLRGLTSRLDYIQALGATALYLLPISRNSDHYHGYTTVDHRAVDPDYGTLDDLAELVREAHARGMAVLLDFVGEYSSPEHPFFQDAMDYGGYRDWYLWAGSKPGGWVNPYFGGSPWYSPSRGGGAYYSMFFGQPAFDYRNLSVQAYMRDTLRFWLNLGADGFRLDTVGTLFVKGPKAQLNLPENHAWFQAVRRDILDAYQSRFAIGEGGDGSYAFSAAPELHAEMASWWGNQIMTALAKEDGAAMEAFPSAGSWGTTIANHDVVKPRSLTRFAGNEARAKLAATVLLTAPGIPFVYYGEEVGMRSLTDGHIVGAAPPWDDERLRSPMQWDGSAAAGFTTGTPYLGVNDDYAAHNVAQASADPGSILAHYRKLIAIRKGSPALQDVGSSPVTVSDPSCCYAVVKQAPTPITGPFHIDDTLVVLNVTGRERAITLDLGASSLGSLANTPGQFQAGADLLGGPSFGVVTPGNSAHYPVTVPPYGALILPFSWVPTL